MDGRDMVRFGILEHCGGRAPAPGLTQVGGADSARFDLPMSHGLDTRERA